MSARPRGVRQAIGRHHLIEACGRARACG